MTYRALESDSCEMCAVGMDGICSTEDSKQAEEGVHGGEDSGVVSVEEAVKDFLSLRLPSSPPALSPKPIQARK